MSVIDIVQELGERIKQLRLNADLTQQDIAELAGISRKVVIQAEKGKAQLETIVAILVALGLDKQLDLFIPPTPPSPIQLVKNQSNQRRRASGKRRVKSDPLSW